jgi:integrase/recombinase XerD
VTTPREQAEQYLQLRRALGYKLADHGHLLMQFIGYLEQQGAATVTIEAAVTWAMRPAAGTPSWWRYRLAVVRCFARHLASADPHCQVPPANLLPRASQRQAPYLFTRPDPGPHRRPGPPVPPAAAHRHLSDPHQPAVGNRHADR